MYFKIKRNTKLSKLQGAYANKVGKDVNGIRWVLPLLRPSDGVRRSLLDPTRCIRRRRREFPSRRRALRP